MDPQKPASEEHNYTREQARAKWFLENFHNNQAADADDQKVPRAYHNNDAGKKLAGNTKYMRLLQQIKNRNPDKLLEVLEVELDDVDYFHPDPNTGGDDARDWLAHKEQFVLAVESNTRRFQQLFAKAADSILADIEPSEKISFVEKDTRDVLQELRAKYSKAARDRQPDGLHHQDEFPEKLTRRFDVVFRPRGNAKKLTVRHVKSDHVGHLVTVTGIVTRVSDVKPKAEVITYMCEDCGAEVYQTITGNQFTPLAQCSSQECTNSRVKGRLFMQTRGSKFTKFQRVTLQEMPDHVPVGNVPRTMEVSCIGTCTRQCTAGDQVTIEGIWLPRPFTGFQAMRAGLSAVTYLEAMKVIRKKKTYAEQVDDETLANQVEKEAQSPHIYSRLARSIAPEIFGNEDVKKALLLSLVSGVTKQMSDGMRIRGDINILLMGDPGVAKSQLLKHLSVIAPRAVYTSGKGSSGVGLTAAVVRDPSTKEVLLEGGALVLADMGICCIDEFDKMEDSDRTAIYEVMEQQTVSIAKAGITCTLNARTTIIAAANPVFGRYNKKLIPEQNIDLPAALLSRFDLMFILVDTPDHDHDLELAKHICHVHQHLTHPKLDFEPFSPKLLRSYVARARGHDPVIPPKLTEHIVANYVNMRQTDVDAQKQQMLGTPRVLLSILRLSQALARLRFADEVTEADVDEAMRLMVHAKSSMLDEEDDGHRPDYKSAIYGIIKNYMETRRKNKMQISELQRACNMKGFSDEMFWEVVDEYAELDMWMVNTTKTALTLVDFEDDDDMSD